MCVAERARLPSNRVQHTKSDKTDRYENGKLCECATSSAKYIHQFQYATHPVYLWKKEKKSEKKFMRWQNECEMCIHFRAFSLSIFIFVGHHNQWEPCFRLHFAFVNCWVCERIWNLHVRHQKRPRFGFVTVNSVVKIYFAHLFRFDWDSTNLSSSWSNSVWQVENDCARDGMIEYEVEW